MHDNKGVRFIFTTVIGGVIFLVPVVIFGMILVKALGFMKIVAEPMAEWMPVDSIGGIALANLLAVLGIVLVCFLAGMVARHAVASAAVERLESSVLVKLPGYMMIKSLVNGFDASQVEGLRTVLLQTGSTERIGFEIQKLEDGRSMVFLPGSPNAFSGITQVCPPDLVTYLDIHPTRIIELSENFGHGVEEVLAARKPTA